MPVDSDDLFTFETEPAPAAPKKPRASGVTPRVTSGFDAPRDGGRRRHRATDYAFAEGDPLSVNRGGRVKGIGEDKLAGKHLFIDHGDGYESSYSHLSGIDVEEGDEIEPGVIFGRAGSTGKGSGPHVHHVVRRAGARVNPEQSGIKPIRGERPFERTYLQFETEQAEEEPVFEFETSPATPPTAGRSALPPGHLPEASDASPAAAAPTGRTRGSRHTTPEEFVRATPQSFDAFVSTGELHTEPAPRDPADFVRPAQPPSIDEPLLKEPAAPARRGAAPPKAAAPRARAAAPDISAPAATSAPVPPREGDATGLEAAQAMNPAEASRQYLRHYAAQNGLTDPAALDAFVEDAVSKTGAGFYHTDGSPVSREEFELLKAEGFAGVGVRRGVPELLASHVERREQSARAAEDQARAALAEEIEHARVDALVAAQGAGLPGEDAARAGELAAQAKEAELAAQGGGSLQGELERRARVGALEARALSGDPLSQLELGARLGVEGVRGARDIAGATLQGGGVLQEMAARSNITSGLTLDDALNLVGHALTGKPLRKTASAEETLLYRAGADVKKVFGEDADLAPEFVAKVARGGGSSVPFFLLGALSGGSGAAAGLLGAVSQAGDTYEGLTEKGATGDARLAGSLAGMGVGASEMFGVGQTLNRVTGGLFVRSFARFLRDTGREATEEALQEFFQTASGEAILQLASDREPTLRGKLKNLFARAGEIAGKATEAATVAAFVGGGAGAGVSAAHQALGDEEAAPTPSTDAVSTDRVSTRARPAPESLSEQLYALRARARAVVEVPAETLEGERVVVPAGMRSFKTFDGGRVIYDPDQVSREQVVAAMDAGKLGELAVSPRAPEGQSTEEVFDGQGKAVGRGAVPQRGADAVRGEEAEAGRAAGARPVALDAPVEARVPGAGAPGAAGADGGAEGSLRHHSNYQPRAESGAFVEGAPHLPEEEIDRAVRAAAEDSGVSTRGDARPDIPDLPVQGVGAGSRQGARELEGRAAEVSNTDTAAAPDSDDEVRRAVEAADPEAEPTWREFPRAEGSPAVPRAAMPQIKSEHRGAMTQFLKGRGVTHERVDVDPRSLRASQAEYSPEKAAKAKTFDGPERPVLVSSDGFVLDGHHQWLGRMDEAAIPAIRLDAPINRLLLEAARFPSSGVDEASAGAAPKGEENAPSNTDTRKRDTPAAEGQGAPKVGDSYRGKDGRVLAVREAKGGQVTLGERGREDGPTVVLTRDEFGRDFEKTAHKYSSTQVDIPRGQADHIREQGRALIPDEALYTDPDDDSYGREGRPHVTVKYGLHTENANDVRWLIRNEPPVRLRLGKTSVFPARDGSPFDVVKVDVDSADLRRLNAKIGGRLKVTDTHPDYVPHVTLAYVKAGEGEKFAGDSRFDGVTVKLDRVVFSSSDGRETAVRLEGKAAPEPTRYQLTGVRRRVSFDPAVHDLTRFVISEGGLRVDRDGSNRGEIAGLHGLRPGLINNKTGKTAEELSARAAEAGFASLEDGEYFVDGTLNITTASGDQLIQMLLDDAAGLRKYYSRAAAEVTARDLEGLSPEAIEELDAEARFLADGRVVRLLREAQDGTEDEGTREGLYVLAGEYGLPDEAADYHLELAREGGAEGAGSREAGAGEGAEDLDDISFDFSDDEEVAAVSQGYDENITESITGAARPFVPQTREEYEAVKARLLERLGSASMRASYYGLDLITENLPDLARLAAYHIREGAAAFEDAVAKLVADLGEGILPHASRIFGEAQRALKEDRWGRHVPLDREFIRRSREFADKVERHFDGTRPINQGELVHLGETPAVLQSIGAPALPLVLRVDDLEKIQGAHGLELETVRQLPLAVADPVAVFSSSTQPNALVILSEIDDRQGRPLTIAIHLARHQSRSLIINRVASAYGRNNRKDIARWVSDGLLRYFNTRKGPAWFTSSGLHLPQEVQTKQGLYANIVTERDVVKTVARKGAPRKFIPADEEQYESLKRALKARFSADRLRSSLFGLDVIAEAMPELAALGAYHVRNGARSLAEFTARMVADLGEGIRPHVEKIYAEARKLVEGEYDASTITEPINDGRGVPSDVRDASGDPDAGAAGDGEEVTTPTVRDDAEATGAEPGRAAERGDAEGRGDSRERAFPKTLEAADLVGGADRFYTVHTHQQARDEAEEIIRDKGLDGALELLRNAEDFGAEHTALGYLLDKAFMAEGRTERANEAAKITSRQLTRSGQASAAAAMVAPLGPERAAVVAVSIARDAGKELTPEHLANIRKLAARTLEEEERADKAERLLANAQATIRRLRDERPAKKRETPGVKARKMTNDLISRLEKMEAEARGRLKARQDSGGVSLLTAVEQFHDDEKGAVALTKGHARFTPPTETAEFKRWFGDSKVVGADGNPLVVYHGTPEKFEAFDSDYTDYSDFYFAKDEKYARTYGEPMAVYLSLQNPYKTTAKAWRSGVKERIEDLREQGYDGAIIKGDGTSRDFYDDIYVAFEPTQIKSATGNRGTFSPRDPSILGASTIPLDIVDLAVVGAAKMARGVLKRTLWFNDMLADFGEGVRDSLPLIRREAAKLYREEKRKLRREALAHAVTGGRPEDFTDAEIDELIESRARRLRESARAEREVAREAGERPAPREKPDPKQGPKLGEGVGRKEGPRLSEMGPKQGPSLSEAPKEGPPAPTTLAREVMRITAGADEIVRAGALLIAGRGDLTPEQYFEQMKTRFGVNERRVAASFREAFEAVRRARKNLADRAAERAVTGGDPSALPRDEVRRLVAEREQAREAAAEARRELAKAFEALDPPDPVDRALGILADVWNLPRSLKSTLDLSALGRQGYLGALTDFEAARDAAGATVAPLARSRRLSEEGFESVVKAIREDKHYRLAKKSGLYLATREHARGDTAASLRAIARREEAFASRLASRIPGVGASERSYVGTLDTLRMGMFSHLADEVLANKELNEGQQRKALEYAAKRVNHLTGRGTIGKADSFGGVAVFVNGVFFAPRFMISRFQAMSPLQAARAPKGARLITGKKVGRVLVLHGLALAALSLAGFDVEWDDPESPDWMKARLRGTNHVYDFAAGLQQPARAILRSAARAVKAGRGKLKGSDKTFFDIWGDFFERKLHPSASYARGALTGKTLEYDEVTGKRKEFEYLGHVWDEKGRMNPGGGLVDLGAPLFFKDVWESYQRHGASGVAASAPAFFGVGYQDYPARERVELSRAAASAFEEHGKEAYVAPARLSIAGRDRELTAEERKRIEADVRAETNRRVESFFAPKDEAGRSRLDRYRTAGKEEQRKVLDGIQRDAAEDVRAKFKRAYSDAHRAEITNERETKKTADRARREELIERKKARGVITPEEAARAVERLRGGGQAKQ